MSGTRSVFADIAEGFGKAMMIAGAAMTALGIGNYIGHLIMKRKPEEYMDEKEKEEEKKCSVCHQTLDGQTAKEKDPFYMTQPQELDQNSQQTSQKSTWNELHNLKQEEIERRQKLAQDMYRKQEAAQAAYVKRVEEEAARKVRAELMPVTQERLEEALSPMKLTRSTPLSEEEKQSSSTLPRVAEPVAPQTQQVAEPTTEPQLAVEQMMVLSGTPQQVEEVMQAVKLFRENPNCSIQELIQMQAERIQDQQNQLEQQARQETLKLSQPEPQMDIKVTQPESQPNQVVTTSNTPTHYNQDMLFPPGVQWVYPADQFTRSQETPLETSQWDLVGQHSAVLPARENQEQDVQAVPIPLNTEVPMYSEPQPLDAPVAETQTGSELTAPMEQVEQTTPVEQPESSLNEPNLNEPSISEPCISEPSNILDPTLVHPDGTSDLLDESSTVVLLARMKVTSSS